jgi:hypothetical protein
MIIDILTLLFVTLFIFLVVVISRKLEKME